MNAEDAKTNPTNTRDDKDNDNDKDKEPTLANAPSTPDTPTAKKVQCPPGQEVSLLSTFCKPAQPAAGCENPEQQAAQDFGKETDSVESEFVLQDTLEQTMMNRGHVFLFLLLCHHQR
jgi:hypothetical protein